MGRARKAQPKRNQLCLRLTDHQLELLNAYTELQDHASAVDSIRAMIDGMEDWMARRGEISIDEPEEHQSHTSEVLRTKADSGPPPITDVEPIDVEPIDVDIDVDIDVMTPSLGDFGGRPRVGLPHMEGEDD